MSDAARHVVAVLIPLVLLGGYVVLQARNIRRGRRKREWYRQHPDEFPSRRVRVLRILPFALLLAAFTIWSAAVGRLGLVPLGVISLACFAFLIYRIATGREDLDGN